MPSLDELGNKYGTDKGSAAKADGKKGHNYLATYERHLPADRNSVGRVLEIGVKRGASIWMWEEYFPNAQIYGLDIKPKTSVTGPRITTRVVDQSDAGSLEAFARECGPFDLIIDDGSHIWSHQITSLQTLLKYVAEGGRYIIEDLHTSFVAEFGSPGGITGVEYVSKCFEKVLCGKWASTDDPFLNKLDQKVESLLVMRNAAIFFCR